MAIELTEEEIGFLKDYQTVFWSRFNSLLSQGYSYEERMIDSKYREDPEYKMEDIAKIKAIYKAMLKSQTQSQTISSRKYRKAPKAEITAIKKTGQINQMISATDNRNRAYNAIKGKYEKSDFDYDVIELKFSPDVPSFYLNSLSDSNTQEAENETLVSPFTQVTNILQRGTTPEGVGVYEITLEKQEFEQLPPEERQAIYEKIAASIQSIPEDIKQIVKLKGKRELAQLRLGKHRPNPADYKDKEDKYPRDKKGWDEDQEYISKNITDIGAEIITLEQRVNEWKELVAKYVKAELREVEIEFEQEIEDAKKKQEEEKQRVVAEKTERETAEAKESAQSVQNRNRQVDGNVNAILAQMEFLRQKQEKYAGLARKMGFAYEPFYTPDEDRRTLNTMLQQVNGLRRMTVPELGEDVTLEEIEKYIRRLRPQAEFMRTLQQDVNNISEIYDGKNAKKKEEGRNNSKGNLVKGVDKRFIEIMSMAERRKREAEIDRINKKGIVGKMVGSLTGKNSKDSETRNILSQHIGMIEHVRRNGIDIQDRRVDLYAIIGDIELFVQGNKSNPVIKSEVQELEYLAQKAKETFGIGSNGQAEIDVYKRDETARRMNNLPSNIAQNVTMDAPTRWINGLGLNKSRRNIAKSNYTIIQICTHTLEQKRFAEQQMQTDTGHRTRNVGYGSR